MTGRKKEDAAREDAFLGGLIPQVAEHLAKQQSEDFDAVAGQARFETWLAAHTREPALPGPRVRVPAPRPARTAWIRRVLIWLSSAQDAIRVLQRGLLIWLSGTPRQILAEYPTDRSGAVGSGPGLLPRIADELAAAVGRQWAREAAMRRLNDPYPLPVSWTAAAADLAAPWESLTELAASGACWPPPERVRAAGPGELAGKGGELAGVLGKVPTGRLGGAGRAGVGQDDADGPAGAGPAGRPGSGQPGPGADPCGVLGSLRPGPAGLAGHPADHRLPGPGRAGPPAGAAGQDRATALIEAGLVVPVLDGLDEIPDKARGVAISRINDALPPGGQVLATCRTRQYQDAVRPPDGPEVTLAGAAAIQLRPLDADAVAATCAMTSPARSSWPAGTPCWRCSGRRPRPGRR